MTETQPRPTFEPSVLVVEDDHRLREVIVELLRQNGWHVSWATDGADALATFRSDPAGLVITDIIMPKLDGLALVRRIREFDFETPILVLTGYSSYENCLAALRAGANDFLAKPFDNDALLLAARQAVDTRPAWHGTETVELQSEIRAELRLSAAQLAALGPGSLAAAPSAWLDGLILAAGFRRRRLAIRRALEEVLALAIPAVAAAHGGASAAAGAGRSRAAASGAYADEPQALSLRAEFDPQRARLTLSTARPLVSPEARETGLDDPGPARRRFLIQSFSDEVAWAEDGLGVELIFYRPRPDRPERQGA